MKLIKYHIWLISELFSVQHFYITAIFSLWNWNSRFWLFIQYHFGLEEHDSTVLYVLSFAYTDILKSKINLLSINTPCRLAVKGGCEKFVFISFTYIISNSPEPQLSVNSNDWWKVSKCLQKWTSKSNCSSLAI